MGKSPVLTFVVRGYLEQTVGAACLRFRKSDVLAPLDSSQASGSQEAGPECSCRVKRCQI